MAETKEEKKPWEQMEGESPLWYGRFVRYRLLGEKRSVMTILNQERHDKGMEPASVAPGGWTSIVMRWHWKERAEAWDLSQVKSTEQLFQEEADKFREDERKVFRMLFIKLAQRVQTLRPEELSPDGLSHAMLSVARALEKVYGLESKAVRKGDEEDEEFTEGLAAFRRLQAQAIQAFEQRKATGTDGRASTTSSSTKPAAPVQKKQPENGPPQSKEIKLFPR